MAKANVMIDNQKTRVTEWTFEVGDETGQHIHEYDYVVVPMLDGELKIINHDGVETISKLKKVCGLTFTSYGFDVSSYYKREEDSFKPECSWIFEGIGVVWVIFTNPVKSIRT